jgi:signal peptidase II
MPFDSSGDSGVFRGPVSPYFHKSLALAAVVFVLDQLTKWWILEKVMQPPRVIPITPFFNLVLGWNRGVSFGLFNTDSAINDWLLPLITAGIAFSLVIWLRRAERRRVAVGLALIVGGAVGNLIDRLRFGAVADFLDIHVFGWHWPAFNVADSGITIGAMVILADALLTREKMP